MSEQTIPEGLEPAAVTPTSNPAGEADPPKFDTEQAAPAEQATPPEQGAEDQEDERPKRNRFQERIDGLVRDKHAAERLAQQYKKQLEALQSAQPTQVDPDDWEAQQRESTRSVIREERMADTQTQAEMADQAARQMREQLFMTRIEAARDRIPDLDQSLQVFATLPVTVEAAEIIAESDKAAEIAHYLARNPREAFAIAQMSPAQQGRALARIENSVSLPARRTSSAPPPPPIVTGASAAATKTPSEMTAAEYIAHRQKEWKAGRA